MQLAQNQSAQIDTLRWDLSLCQDAKTACDEAAGSGDEVTSKLGPSPSSSQNGSDSSSSDGNYCNCSCSSNNNNNSEGVNDNDDDADADSAHPAAWAVAERAVLADAAHWAQRGLLGNATLALEDGIMRQAHRSSSQSSAVLPLALGTLLLRRGLPHQALLACRSAAERAANVAVESEDSDDSKRNRRSDAFGGLAAARAELCIGRSLMLTTGSSKSRQRSATRPRAHNGSNSSGVGEESSGPLGAAAAFKRAVDLLRAHSGRAESPASLPTSVRLDPNLIVVGSPLRSNQHSAAVAEEADALADWGAALQSAGQGEPSIQALEAAMALIIDDAASQAASQAATLDANTSTSSSDKEALVMSGASLQRAARLAYNLGLARRAAGDFAGSVSVLEDAEQLSRMASTYQASDSDHYSDDDDGDSDDNEQAGHSGAENDMSVGELASPSAPCPAAVALALGAALADSHRLDAAISTTRRALGLTQSAASTASVSVTASRRGYSNEPSNEGNSNSSSELWAAPGAAAMAVLGSTWGGVNGDAAYGPRAGLNLGLLFLRQADDYAKLLHGDGKVRGRFIGGGTDVGGTAADAGSSAALFANQRTRALEAAATEFDAVLQTIDNAAAAALANVQASSAAAAARVSAFGPLAATPGAAPPLQLLLPPPALAAAVAGSATAHRLLGHEPLAYAMLARLLRLPPGLLPPRVRRKAGFDLGRALRQQDRFHEALEVLEAAAAVLRTRQPSGQLNSSEFGVDEDEAWAAAWAHAEDDDYGGGEGSSGDLSNTADGNAKDDTDLANDGGFVVSSSLWTVSEHDLWLELGLTRHVVSAPLREASASGGGAQADEPLTQPSHAGPRGAAVAYRRALSSRPNSVPALKLLAAALEDSAAGSGRSTSGGAESSAGTSSKRTPSQNERESPSAETEESLGARHARLRVVLGEEIPVVAPAASQAESVNATRIEGEPSFLQLGSSAQATPSTSSAAANTVDAAAEVDAAATASAAVATPVRDAASPADSPPTSPAMSADETPVPDPPLSTGETIAETEEEVSGDSKESTRESTKGETPQNETDHKEVKEAGEEDSEEDDEEEEAPLLDFEEPPALPLPTFPEDSAAAVKTASAYLKIGRAYATTGKWELALKEAIKAMLKAPSLAAPHALAAQALETTRHFAEAASAHLDAFARNASDWTGADAALRLVSAGTSASSSSGGGGVGGSGSALLPRADAQAVLQRLLGELRGGLLEFALPSTDSTTADNGAATPSDTAAAVGSGTRNEPLDRLSAARLALGQLLRADASEHRTKAQQYTQRADAYATAAAKARGTGTAAGKGSSGSGDNNEEEEEVMDLDAAPEVDLAQAAKLEAAETADRTAATEATTQADAMALEADSSLQRCSGNSSKLAMLCLDQRAKLAFEREEYKAAVKHWRSAARVASEKGQHSDAAVHYANIGAAKRELNYLKSAAAAYEQALMSAAAADTAPALGGGTSSSDVAGQIHFNLGVTKQQMGDTAGALASWDKAHEAGLRHPRLNQLRDDAQRNLTAVSGGDSSSSSRNSDGVTTDLGSGGERMSGKATEAVAEKPVQAEEVPNVKNNGYETRQAAAPAAAAAATHTAAGTSATPPAAVAAAAAVPTARAAPTTASEEAVGARQPPAGVRRQRYSHLFEDAEQQGESADSDASTARAAGATGGAAVAAGQKFGGNTSPRAAAAAGSANSGLESNNAAAEDEESSLESKLFAGLGDDDEDDEDGGGFGNGGGGGAGWSLSTAFQHAGQALSQVPKHFGAGVAAVRAWLDPEEAELEKLRALALAPVDVPNPHLARQQAGGGSGVGRGSDSAAAQRAQMAAAFAQQQRSAKAATTGAGGAGNAGGAGVGGGGGRAATPAGAVGDATSDATGELGMQELLEQLRQKRAAQISPQQQQQQAAAQRGAPAANTEEPQDLFAQFRQQQERQQLLQQQQQQQRQSASASSSSSQGNGATAARSAEDGVGGLQELLAQLQQQPQQPQQQQQAAAPQQAVQQQPQQQQQQPDEAEEGESEGLQALLQRLRDKKLAEHQQQQRQQQLEDQASGEDFAGEEEADPAAATAAGGMLATQNANTISSSSSSSSSLNQLLADLRAQQQQQRSEQEEEDENGEGDGGASGGGLSGIHGMLSGDEEVDEAHAYQAASNKGGSRG